MKRKEMEELFDDDSLESLKDVLDDMENQFNKIRDCLAGITINNLEDVVEAHDIARDSSDDLY